MRTMRRVGCSQEGRATRRAASRGALAALLACLVAVTLTQAAQGEPAWTTYHRDPARSGDDPEVGNPLAPSLTWQSPPLGAPIYGQPLVLGARVYVATVGDRLYALEASSGKVIWEKSAGVPVPSGELPCGNITPTVGIVGTPVIDTSTNAIYAVADTWDASTKEAHHVLKGYALGGGEEVLSTPVDPSGVNPKAQLQRTALNLDKGSVIFGLGGNDGDCGNYRGMVVSVPEHGGSPSYWIYQPAPPATSGGAVWGASGPAVDAAGLIYAANGNPNGGAETYDYSDSVIQLQANLTQSGYFKPESWLQDSNNDTDLGSAGPELLPGGVLFQSGKNNVGYLIDEATMGSGAPPLYSHQVCSGAGSFGGDAFANGTIYVPCADGTRALSYNQAAHSFSELWHGPTEAKGSPILSAGLVWVPSTKFGGRPGTTLYGLELSTGKARYTVPLPSGVQDHFASPSAAAGRLLLATGERVSAYRIAQLSPTVSTSYVSAAQTSATPHAVVNPNGVLVSECKFEYGTTTSYGQSAQCAQSPGSGENPVAVSAALESLSEGTTYHFRITATNPGGTSFGADRTFATLLVHGPYWYQNHVKLAETGLENGRPAMAWGSLTLENAKGAFTCQTLVGGSLANPTRGGAGKGLLEAVTLYDCVEPVCEGSKGLLQVTPEKLKWSSVLIEEAGLFRDRIEGIALREICVGGAGNVQFHGTLKPQLEAGTIIGAAPARLAFGASAGSLQGTAGAGAVSARLKFMGFEGGEIISAKKT
jgi:outer membrane protein assembly factor BamB